MPTRQACSNARSAVGPVRREPAGCRGFTLLEVMVALAVVALALGAIIESTGQGARNAAYLRDRTIAHWVATDVITEMQVAKDFAALGLRNGSRDMAGQTWEWTSASVIHPTSA